MSEPLIGGIPSNWRVDSLGNVCTDGGGDIQTGPFGSQLHASDYVQDGVPVVMPANIGDNRIETQGIARVSEANARRLSRHRLEDGDIIYSRRGDVERRALVGLDQVGWLCGTGCLRIRPGRLLSGRWLSYYLAHKSVRRWIVQRAIGATMPNLNTGTLQSLPVVVPPPDNQAAVAAALGNLDDKIDLSRRIMATSETLLRAAYDSIEDRRGATLSDIAIFVRDGVNPTTLSPETAYIGLEHMPQGSISLPIWGIAGRVASGKSRFRVKDVLFGKLRPYFHKVGIAPVDGVCSQEVLVLRPIQSQLLAPTLLEASSNEIVAYATAVSSGTRMPRVNWQELASFPIRVPTARVLADFNKLAEPLIDLVIRCVHENRTLSELRDTLLPELISGRMTVN
jgi:type I restriction enzyme S subunit